MGIGIVLLFWAVIGTTGAGVGAVFCAALASKFVHHAGERGRRAVLVCGLFPFACLAWAGAVFVFQALVNEELLHRDPGLGDAWRCPLPNGYALLMIDEPDDGCVYNPKTQADGGGVGEQEDAVVGVRVLQIAGRYILGGSDTQFYKHIPDEGKVDSYFLLDTATGKRQTFPTIEALGAEAAQKQISLALQPINDTYQHYRYTLFDLFVVCLLLAPPLLTAGLLVRWIVRLRKHPDLVPQPT